MTRRGPRPAHERLRRLLVMLPWLMERGEASVAEMAAHFALGESDLVADLELASMCGLPPFVDEMIDVYIDEGTVFAGVPRVFTRPLRLTAPEGFGLLAAGRAAMSLPGAEPGGPLGRALDKLGRVLGGSSGGVVVELARPPLTDQVADAAESGERLEITYWTPARSEASERTITPRAVFAAGGHWYVLADDHRSGGERSFRLDRVLGARNTAVFDPARAVVLPDTDRWFADDPEFERITLRIPTELVWMIERYPIDALTSQSEPRDHDGFSVVVMPVTNEEWLRHLLVRLGPRTEVLSPDRWADLAAETARGILANYG